MSDAFTALKISERVYWVGAIDWGLRNFHGYKTSRGSTYNAFLILTDKVTLIDTVKPQFYDEMMSRIRSVIEPSKIDYVVSNHAEMDHSGALPRLAKELNLKKIVASPKGVEALNDHFGMGDALEVVKTGDKLDLGNATLSFIETRMLHWPDSMFAFLEEEGILFSNDAFGMHLATAERYADELDPWIIKREAAKYYANILLHLSPIVLRLLDKFPSYNLDVKMIAPDHGPIWRQDVGTVLQWYRDWAEQKSTNKAVVIYDTMWQSTARMAAAVGGGLTDGGARVELMPLEGAHRSDVVTELLDAGALIVGSPTMNNQIYPTVADVMNYITGLKPKNLVGASFGSYGWSGEATKHLDAMMDAIKVDLVQPGLNVKYVPSEADLAAGRELGLAVAKRIV
ncbi:MAG: FprA family A-type flavoprotein [Deltaproteobacteria bacterium]|nr:FprA family A-type flavoprotein [Deltaproteobacteria bacterium]MBN2672527.1 FprA family A-type flavoprotein [Deltaproteobacteria bacterium]